MAHNGQVHLLELLVTVYIFVAPGALVCKLLWVAPIVTGFFTLFFYGFFVLVPPPCPYSVLICRGF